MRVLSMGIEAQPWSAPPAHQRFTIAAMHVRVFGIALALAALVLGGGWFLMNRMATSAPEPPLVSVEDRETTERAAARPPSADPPVAPRERPPARSSAEATDAAPAEAAAARGILHIDSDVAGAQVFLDRTFAGNAPVTIRDVAPGSHRVNVSAEGFDGVAEDIEVQPGPQNLTLKLREIRLDVTIPVVHKHRVGSCTGQLIATPEGIRYETAHAEDAFAAGLRDLDHFQVDYLEKNLRVRPRGGRQYNFTHPEGNADSLFVFHRDVDKARAKLAP